MGDKFDTWKTKPLAFSEQVQGKPATREALLLHFTYESGSDYIEERQVAEMQRHFENFIDHHPDKLDHLLELFTGNPTLERGKFKIKVLSKEDDLDVSRLFPEVGFPYRSSYDSFEEMLLPLINSN